MLTVYSLTGDKVIVGDHMHLDQSPLWVDLFDPTPEEAAQVEAALNLDLPTREEMQEIETSSRLYTKDQAVFVTAPVLTKSDGPMPEAPAVTFILLHGCTVTVRHATPRPFETYPARLLRQHSLGLTADAVLMGLLEAIVDRVADVLEGISSTLNTLSQTIFHYDPSDDRPRQDYRDVLASVGRAGDLTAKANESLLALARAVTFLAQAAEDMTSKNSRAHLKTMTRDIRSLSEHSTYLNGKIGFLLDATLGMINIEQNNIIKIFSVMALIFMPPTLIASIYGMNFQNQPELHWEFGYPLALVLMIAVAVLPYRYFKKRRWL